MRHIYLRETVELHDDTKTVPPEDYLNAALFLHELYPQKCEAADTLYDDI
jgi:hypothetical protein